MNLFFAIYFIILNILDVTTTRKILASGGYEANPIARLLMKFHLFLPVKIIITLSIAVGIITISDLTTNLVLCGIVSIFVLNNYYQIYKYNQELETVE